MASWWAGVELSDCYFYHRVRLKNGSFIDGPWNLIGGEDEYLGGVSVDGRRVLEFGPASGWLTTWLELNGASVVGFDVGWDVGLDLIPFPHLDLVALRPDYDTFINRTQNAWWYLRREYELSAQAVYGSIYDLPTDIGRFDISIYGSILLHLRDPFRALEQGAQRTDGCMVVVEPLVLDLLDGGSIARWNQTHGENPTNWWQHSPSIIADMLAALGFEDVTTTYHYQPYKFGTETHVDGPCFTVIGRRNRDSQARRNHGGPAESLA
jgi:O-methyltransferase